MRLTFPLSLAALALAACAPESEGKEEPAPPFVPGFELANAAESADPPRRELHAPPLDFTSESSEVIDLTVDELAERLSRGGVWLIDVRTDEEVAEGMISGAEHIPLADFAPGPAMLERAAGREIILYCRSGRRSAIAGRNLSGFTGEPVPHLAGGIIAWEANGGMVVRR
ncbi:rhodanese-like domain-containing protein [Qipengyuania sp. ASV99]|uniref:rhodanese-like domain-containing protein n=1 Tax=Qipengyuania sp. ASV99 TaxID=3399681 RepID=UPI003A4C7E09